MKALLIAGLACCLMVILGAVFFYELGPLAPATRIHQLDPMQVRLLLANSLQPPGNIFPHWRTAGACPDQVPEHVTLCSVLTPDRMPRLVSMLKRWDGPASILLHHRLGEPLPQLDLSWYRKSHCVGVHLLIDQHPHQLNLWRNVARLLSRSRWTLMADIDFLTSDGLASRISDVIDEGHLKGDRVMVVPSFDSLVAASDINVLQGLWDNNKASPFHAEWPPAQQETDYPRFWEATANKEPPYQVTLGHASFEVYKNHYFFEPYLVMPAHAPFCDMRFILFERNKVACVYELRRAGYEFFVLPGGFMVHQAHSTSHYFGSDSAQKHRSMMATGVWDRFREDLTRRYGEEKEN